MLATTRLTSAELEAEADRILAHADYQARSVARTVRGARRAAARTIAAEVGDAGARPTDNLGSSWGKQATIPDLYDGPGGYIITHDRWYC